MVLALSRIQDERRVEGLGSWGAKCGPVGGIAYDWTLGAFPCFEPLTHLEMYCQGSGRFLEHARVFTA